MTPALQIAGPGADVAFLAARVLFGAVIAFMGLNHFVNVDQSTGYAEMKGLPAPRLGVVFSGGLLVFGGLGIAVGAFTALAAGAVALFLVVSTPLFHDFWAVPDDQRQSEMTSFLKNVVMLGGSLVFLALSSTPWQYALGVGVF